MKVLIVYHAGASEGAISIFNELSSIDGISVSVIAPVRIQVDHVYDSSGWLLGEDSGTLRYKLLPVPLRDTANYQRGFQRRPLRAAIRSVRPDIIHVLDEPYSGYLFQVAWERLTICPRTKVLFYGFDNLPLHFRFLSSLKWRLTWAQVAGGLAANSECLANLRKAGFPSRIPLQRIFWGIPTGVFRPMEKSALKKTLNLNHEHLVGFIGRLSTEKGLGILIDAFLRLPKSTHLVLVGSGPMKPELESLSRRSDLLGRFHIRDAMETSLLVQFLNALDVLCLPSRTTAAWKEQYGRVLAEAMACGVPVVGSDSGAIPEVIGDAGLVVPEGDADRLSKALSLALLDTGTRERLRAAGLARAEQELSAKAMAHQLHGFYTRILGKRHA